MKVLIFDDVLWEKRADFAVPGLELVFYPHADGAVAAVAKERPALVLMDYSMEAERSGEEAIGALRATFSRTELRIVAISSDRLWNERMLDAGADDAVPKSHLRAYLSRLVK